ncbi:anti-sigma factor [Pseudolysinimonas sp.]
MTDTRDDITTRAASYAVGALTAAERREVESDARRDRRLAAEVREFTETAAMLGLATEPVAPSSNLRASILDAIAETPQESRVVRGPWLARPAAALLGAAAAVVLAIGGTAVAIQLTREPSPVEQIVAAADYERAVGAVDGGGTVTAVWSASLERAAIMVDGLDELPSSSVYQAWLIDDQGRADPAGTFSASDSTQSIALTGLMSAGDAIGITVEPTGGSEAPTTTPIVVIPTA